MDEAENSKKKKRPNYHKQTFYALTKWEILKYRVTKMQKNEWKQVLNKQYCNHS